MYYYANRVDRSGNQLLTSYANEKSAVKYGGEDATISQTVYRAKFAPDFSRLSIAEGDEGPVVRSMIRNSREPTHSEGPYKLWARSSGKWFQTPLSFDSYGAANTSMKAMIAPYEAMVILVDESEPLPKNSPVYTPILDMDNL